MSTQAAVVAIGPVNPGSASSSVAWVRSVRAVARISSIWSKVSADRGRGLRSGIEGTVGACAEVALVGA